MRRGQSARTAMIAGKALSKEDHGRDHTPCGTGCVDRAGPVETHSNSLLLFAVSLDCQQQKFSNRSLKLLPPNSAPTHIPIGAKQTNKSPYRKRLGMSWETYFKCDDCEGAGSSPDVCWEVMPGTARGACPLCSPHLMCEDEETKTAVLWVLSITRQFSLKQKMPLLCLPSSQALTAPVLSEAFTWARSQTETNWDGGARRGRQRLVALIHPSPERCWRHSSGVLHVAGTGRIAGLPVRPQPLRLPEKARQTSLSLLHRHGSGLYVPLQMTTNAAAVIHQLWAKMSYSFCQVCWLCWGGFAKPRAHISEAGALILKSCWLYIIHHSFVFSSWFTLAVVGLAPGPERHQNLQFYMAGGSSVFVRFFRIAEEYKVPGPQQTFSTDSDLWGPQALWYY